MDDLSGKTVIVTGACGGIGRTTVEILAGYGMNVVACDLSNDVDGMAEQLSEGGLNVIGRRLDVAAETETAELVKECVERFGKLDCAFNNAGVEQCSKPMHELTLDEWQRAISVDLTGIFIGMKYQALSMMKSGGGAIVNTASALGKVAIPNAAEYVAAKHAVVGLSKAAALDYAMVPIRINAICPGIIETPMISRLSEDENFKSYFDQLRYQHPIGRFGRSQEIAETVAWLFSQKSSLCTGAAISVDGGYTTI